MIVLCLGAYSSGSTWIFNVARQLVAHRDPLSSSLYSTAAGHLLAQAPLTGGDLVVKAHAVELDLLALIRHADVRVIRTWRDPRDATASLMARFGRCYHEAVATLQESLAALCAVPAGRHVLDLRYEDAFTADAATVRLLARFLDVTVDERTAQAIFDGLTIEAVKSRTETMTTASGEPLDADYFDPDTHWHPGHVRQGATGEWNDYLDQRLARVVGEALDPLATPLAWRDQATRWDGLLFVDAEDRRPPESGRVALAPPDRPTISGPMLRVPAGHWRALIEATPAQPGDRLCLLVEVRTAAPRPSLLASRLLTVSAAQPAPTIEFDHCDGPVAITIALTAVAGNFVTALVFQGVTLSYLGPSRLIPPGEARLIVNPTAPLGGAPPALDTHAAPVPG